LDGRVEGSWMRRVGKRGEDEEVESRSLKKVEA
jgi:hypothetical protein